MARNKVQFRKGVGLNDFLKQYGTGEQCFDALYRWRWPAGFKCPHCGQDKHGQLRVRKPQVLSLPPADLADSRNHF